MMLELLVGAHPNGRAPRVSFARLYTRRVSHDPNVGRRNWPTTSIVFRSQPLGSINLCDHHPVNPWSCTECPEWRRRHGWDLSARDGWVQT